MRSRRLFLHLGFVAAAALAVSSASAAPAYHGSPRGGGTVTARDEAARTFTAVRRGRASTYQVTDKTRFVVGCQGRRGGAGAVASCGSPARGRHRRYQGAKRELSHSGRLRRGCAAHR